MSRSERPPTKLPNPTRILSPSPTNQNIGPRVAGAQQMDNNVLNRIRENVARHQKVTQVYVPDGTSDDPGVENTVLTKEITYPDPKLKSGKIRSFFEKTFFNRS